MEAKDQWYTNRELFEMINDLKEELIETRRVVHEYNALRKDLGNCMQRLIAIEQRGAGREALGEALLRWGGWLVGLAGVISAIYFAAGRV